MNAPGVFNRYTLTITLSGVLFLVGLALILAYWMLPAQTALVQFTAAVIAALAAIYTAFFVAETLRTQIRQHALQSSFALVREFTDVEFVRYRATLEKDFDHQTITPAEMYERITENNEFDVAVRALLTICSRASVAIRQGYADEKTLYMALDTVLPATVTMLTPYITKLRERRQDPHIFKNAEMLANAWKDGKMLSTGQAIGNVYQWVSSPICNAN